MIKVLLGKNKEKEEAFVFTEEGEKKEIMEYNKEYADGWKSSVYQKSEKTDFSFWYCKQGVKGLKEEMEDRMKNGDSGIMETPIITDEEFVKVINNMKNGKASGVDDVPAELMKHLIKNEKIKKYLLK